MVVCWAVGVGRLRDDLAVPAGKVVDVDDAVGAGGETGLDEAVVFTEIFLVQVCAELAVDEELPRYCCESGGVGNSYEMGLGE